MNQVWKFGRSAGFALGLALASTACASDKKQAASIKQLDDLLGRVERVHLETELCHQRAGAALEALQVVLKSPGGEDLATNFAELQGTARASEDQSYRLRAATGPLKASAEAHFGRWTDDLAKFGSPALRQKSQERMDAARASFDAILAELAPAQSALEVYNKSLKDVTLFLANDLSSQSLTLIEGDVHGLVDQAMGVDQKLKDTLAACRGYVRTHAPAASLAGSPEVQPAADSGAVSKPR